MAKTEGKKKKAVSIELIKDESTSVPYIVMRNLIDEHYPHLSDAKIQLAWRYGWIAEADTGIVKLWKVQKANDLLRASVKWDICILLNGDLWGKNGWKPEHQDFVLDSALCEIAADLDRDGDQKETENGRDMWRVLKPTVQTFPAIVERHGFVTVELQRLAQAAHKADIEARPLFAALDGEVAAPQGVQADPDDDEEEEDDSEVAQEAATSAA